MSGRLIPIFVALLRLVVAGSPEGDPKSRHHQADRNKVIQIDSQNNLFFDGPFSDVATPESYFGFHFFDSPLLQSLDPDSTDDIVDPLGTQQEFLFKLEELDPEWNSSSTKKDCIQVHQNWFPTGLTHLDELSLYVSKFLMSIETAGQASLNLVERFRAEFPDLRIPDDILVACLERCRQANASSSSLGAQGADLDMITWKYIEKATLDEIINLGWRNPSASELDLVEMYLSQSLSGSTNSREYLLRWTSNCLYRIEEMVFNNCNKEIELRFGDKVVVLYLAD